MGKRILSRAIMIQQIYQGSDYAAMLAFVFQRHLQYAQAHQFDFQAVHSNVVPRLDIHQGGWAKLVLVHNALAMGYEHIIWVDTDAIIADLAADLRAGCPRKPGIGMVLNKFPGSHFNVGMLYITNGPGIAEFVKWWLDWYPGPEGWHEQAAINLLAQTGRFNDIIYRIDPKWNSCQAGGSHVDNAVVEAFHGEGDAMRRLRLMRAFLAKLNRKDTK